jgi:hypothetical protein
LEASVAASVAAAAVVAASVATAAVVVSAAVVAVLDALLPHPAKRVVTKRPLVTILPNFFIFFIFLTSIQ